MRHHCHRVDALFFNQAECDANFRLSFDQAWLRDQWTLSARDSLQMQGKLRAHRYCILIILQHDLFTYFLFLNMVSIILIKLC